MVRGKSYWWGELNNYFIGYQLFIHEIVSYLVLPVPWFFNAPKVHRPVGGVGGVMGGAGGEGLTKISLVLFENGE
jgi:hypothetical protein